MACYLSKPVFKWPSNGFSHALPSDTRCCSARLSSQLDKVEVGFFFSISLSRLFLPRQASVCHIVGMRLAPTSFETYAAELIERFSAGEEGDHMIYLSQRRPCKSHPAADEEAGKKKDDWNAGKTNNTTRAWSERQTAICSNVSVCEVVSDCGPSCVCAHAYEALLIKSFFFFPLLFFMSAGWRDDDTQALVLFRCWCSHFWSFTHKKNST